MASLSWRGLGCAAEWQKKGKQLYTEALPYKNLLLAQAMSQWLRSLSALPEDLNLIPNTHIVAHMHR